MTEPLSDSGPRLVRYIGKAIDGPKFLGRYIAIANAIGSRDPLGLG